MLRACTTPQKFKYPRFNFQLTYSASWDAAIATQGIGNMPYDEVQRYAEAFAEMKVFEQQEQDGVRIPHCGVSLDEPMEVHAG